MTHLHSRLFVRVLSRNRDVYFLKLLILAVAFAASILVILFSIHEYGYDTHYKDPDRVFRILAHNTDKNYSGNRLSVSIPPDIVQSINKLLSDRVITSRVKALNNVSAIISGSVFHNQRIYAADTTIHNIFSFEVTDGNIAHFTESHSPVAILSRSLASEYFGERTPLGKTIRLTTFGDTINVAVVAVFNDFPSNTHEDFGCFIRYDSSAIAALNFDPHQSGVYARSSPESITVPSLSGITTVDTEYLLQPIKDIYFGPRVSYEEARHGDMYSMVILICVVSLIFLLALSSFVNLSTMTLPYRSKEIAVKKLSGTSQRQLLFQFAYESVTLTIISLFSGVMILLGSSHYLSSLLGIDVAYMLTHTNPAFLGLIVLTVSTVAISPVFMAVRFIRATPTRLLSSDAITFPRFKRIITIVQLGVSIFLIVSSIVVRRQINYSLLKEPGRNYDQVVYMACPPNIPDTAIYNIQAGWSYRNPHMVDAIAVSQLPGHVKSKDVASGLFVLHADWNFINFFRFAMREGNWFDQNAGDTSIVVNEMALKRMSKVDRNVIGVIQNFNSSFNQPEQPVKIKLVPNSHYNWLCFRVHEVDIRRTVKWIEWRMAEKGFNVHTYFLNPHFESWLTYQDQLNALSGILTLIAAFLAGCAIYGLTISLARDKLKEIAVHQLFGARAADVTRLLARGLLRQLLLALVFFGPLTYILLTELLKTFAYATEFSWLDPAYPIGYCLVVIIGVCAYQAFSLNRGDFVSALKGRS
ncbi:MAG TPA: ABC transporter permease [Cyclobacteriaceae bacterium]|nr:ABC transporter permease [Cyclobacteriaceae bacterium]